MTRSSKLALVTLLAGLLSVASVASVSASAPCTGYAQEHCEQMAAANDIALFRITEVASPVHLFPTNGVGQEHFEAMSVAQPDRFIIAPSVPTATALPAFALEHYEQMATERVTVFSVAARTTVQILPCTGVAREHCEVMTAQTANL